MTADPNHIRHTGVSPTSVQITSTLEALTVDMYMKKTPLDQRIIILLYPSHL